MRLTWAIQVYLEDNKNEKKSKRSRLLGLSSDSPMEAYFVAQSGPPPAVRAVPSRSLQHGSTFTVLKSIHRHYGNSYVFTKRVKRGEKRDERTIQA